MRGQKTRKRRLMALRPARVHVFRNKMDCRVKPGNDASALLRPYASQPRQAHEKS